MLIRFIRLICGKVFLLLYFPVSPVVKLYWEFAVDDGFGVRALREDERQACINLWCEVWPGKDSPAYFRRYFYGDVENLPYYTQVGVLDGKIVSAVHICKRTVACGDFRLTMGGIANVATLPEYRGRGYNTRCLQGAIATMEADAMDFSLLFTGIDDYYRRQGYETLSVPRVYGIIRSDIVSSVNDRYAVRKATAEDLFAIRACYDDYNRRRPIAVQRTPAYWRDWMNAHPQNVPQTLRVAAMPDGNVVGYINTGVFTSAVPYSTEAIGTRVIEYGTRDGLDAQAESEIAPALLRTVAAEMQAQGQTELRLNIALEPAILQAFGQVVTSVQEHRHGDGMVRLLHRENLLRSVAMGLNDRWIAAGRPPGRLTFATPYGPTTLDATGAFLRVTKEETGDADVLPQAALFALLFGMIAFAKALPDDTLHPLITALFPPQASVYYGADGF